MLIMKKQYLLTSLSSVLFLHNQHIQYPLFLCLIYFLTVVYTILFHIKLAFINTDLPYIIKKEAFLLPYLSFMFILLWFLPFLNLSVIPASFLSCPSLFCFGHG